MRHLRIGVVGNSLDGALLTQSLEQLHGIEVVPIEVPEDPQDLTRVLRAGKLGGLVVCEPLLKRLYLIRRALDEGLPVLAETPLATELESVASLLEERMQRSGPPLIAITPWRFAPDLQLARGILAGGALGEPGSFEITMPGPASFLIPNSRLDVPVSAAAIIMHQGWMAMDLLRSLFGDVHSLQATRIRNAGGAAANSALEGVAMEVQAGGGWHGQVLLSIEPVTPKTQWVSLHGADGSLELGWQASWFTSSSGERARIGHGCFGIENYERLANAFADVAAASVAAWANDADLLRTLELVQAAHMSLGAGLAVEAQRKHRRIVAA